MATVVGAAAAAVACVLQCTLDRRHRPQRHFVTPSWFGLRVSISNGTRLLGTEVGVVSLARSWCAGAFGRDQMMLSCKTTPRLS